MDRILTVSCSPHIATKKLTRGIMLDVIIALLPAVVAGALIFGARALSVVFVSIVSAVAAEYLFNLSTKREQTVSDLSAVVTGLLLGLSLRADIPLWQCVLGSVFAIVVVKCLFGGLGSNFANPAICARVFLLLSFTSTVSGGLIPTVSGATDIVSGATPLVALANGARLPSLTDMLIGLRPGAIGESCAIALVIGFLYLTLRGVIHFEVPIIFVGTVFLLSLIADNSFTDATYQILSGGLIISAVFMATDYSSTPKNRSGKRLFAFGCALITFLIRRFGNYPEGVSFAILFMNLLSPYIEKWTAAAPLGVTKNEK